MSLNLPERKATAALTVWLARLSRAQPETAQAAWERAHPLLRAFLARPWLGTPSDQDRDERLRALVADVHAEPKFLGHVRAYSRHLTVGAPHEVLADLDQAWAYPLAFGGRPTGIQIVVLPGQTITFDATEA